jgi:predicted Zn-dependent peptidase
LEFRQHTLDNGLEIVAECNPRAYSTALGFFVKAGSRDETEQNNGVSHFLEHMVFKGTPTRTAADVNRELDEIGSMSNAYTTEEQTVYYAGFLPEYQDHAAELLSDILRPSLREDDFQTEKLVILEEIAKYEDQPPYGAHDKCMVAHFQSHPLARIVLGSAQSVSALTRQQMLDYFHQRYSSGNIVVAASGNVDFPRLVALLQRQCAAWQPAEAPRQTPPAAHHHGIDVYYKEASVLQYIVQLTNGPAVDDDRRYAGRILATVLGDDGGSRMFWDLVDTGLADSAVMGSYEYQGTGLFMTYLSCLPEDTAENLDRVERVFQQAHRDGITDAELAQAKSKILSHLVLQSERPSNRLFAVGNNWLQRREYRTLRETMDRYRRVTRNDLQAILEQYRLNEHTTVAVGPLKQLRGIQAQPLPEPAAEQLSP